MQDPIEPTAIEAVRDFVAHPSTERALYVLGVAVSGAAGWLGAAFRAGRATRVAHADLAETLAAIRAESHARYGALDAKLDRIAHEGEEARQEQTERLARLEGKVSVLVQGRG